jgi:hypothetical protein
MSSTTRKEIFKLTLSFIVFFYIIGSSRFFSNKYDFYSSFNILNVILFLILVKPSIKIILRMGFVLNVLETYLHRYQQNVYHLKMLKTQKTYSKFNSFSIIVSKSSIILSHIL